MNDTLWLAVALALGGGLGGLYFAALWSAVRRVTRLSAWQLQLALWTRLGLLLTGLYLIGGDDWRRWACALLGVVLARTVYMRRLGAQQRANGPLA
jgi:F1F0 ATPase subunit 2